MGAVLWLIDTVIGLIILVLVVNAVLSWLIAFDVVNTRNHFVYQVVRFLDAVTSPLLSPIQRIIPNLGGVDISPIILLLLLQALKILLGRGDVLAAPHGMHFDAYRNMLVRTWRPGGHRNPLQRIALSIGRRMLAAASK